MRERTRALPDLVVDPRWENWLGLEGSVLPLCEPKRPPRAGGTRGSGATREGPGGSLAVSGVTSITQRCVLRLVSDVVSRIVSMSTLR